MISTALTQEWGLRHPIVLAPMGGWSGGALAAAVSAAGGLGMLGVTSNAPTTEWIAEQASVARAGAGGEPFGIGLMVWMLERRPELFDAAVAEAPAVLSLSFGDPSPWVERGHAAGARVVCQVSDAAQAERAAAAGADALVAQGTDAGGHTGAVGTLPLLQLVLEVGEREGLPVLAAGGIVTGAGLAAVIAAGAAGGWIGTRFMATPESAGSDAAKARLLAAGERDTVHTRVYDVAQGIPWPPEYPGRALRSAFSDTWHGREDALHDAGASLDEPVLYAGQGAGAVRELVPAGALVEDLSFEAERRLRAAAARLGPGG